MTADPMFGTGLAGPAGARAANADRDRALDVLKAGFAEGRLTKGEYDNRAGRVLAARTYGELGSLIADLPTGPFGGPVRYPGAVQPLRAAVNSTAVAALTCGIAVFLTMGLTAIPAIVLGHSARRQVRATGERGDGIALAGMVLGWAGVALLAVAIAGLVAVSATGHSHPVIVHPGPAAPGAPVGNPGGPVIGGQLTTLPWRNDAPVSPP
jgi:Domain of unknown function (DUF1707)/Domain of unknown function (DUF4190)